MAVMTDKPTFEPQVVYDHPDGYQISVGKNSIIMADDTDTFTIIPIGRGGLLELSRRLYDIAMKETP